MIRERPALPGPRLGLAVLYYQTGQIDKSVAAYEELVMVFPEHVTAWYNLATIRLDLRDTEAAVEALTRCLELKPDHVHAMFSLGLAYQEVKRFDDARRQFEHLVGVAPEFSPARLQFGIELERHGEIEQAVDQFRQASQLAPGDAIPRQYLERLTRKGDTEAGVAESENDAPVQSTESD